MLHFYIYRIKLKIINIKKVEGCLEGQIGLDIIFDNQIDKSFANDLGKLGKFIFEDAFERPFFKVIVRGYYTLKGSIGNKSLRMIVPETIEKEMLDELVKYIETNCKLSK